MHVLSGPIIATLSASRQIELINLHVLLSGNPNTCKSPHTHVCVMQYLIKLVSPYTSHGVLRDHITDN